MEGGCGSHRWHPYEWRQKHEFSRPGPGAVSTSEDKMCLYSRRRHSDMLGIFKWCSCSAAEGVGNRRLFHSLFRGMRRTNVIVLSGPLLERPGENEMMSKARVVLCYPRCRRCEEMCLCLILRHYGGAKGLLGLAVPPPFYAATKGHRALDTTAATVGSRQNVVVFCHRCQPHCRRQRADVRRSWPADRHKFRALMPSPSRWCGATRREPRGHSSFRLDRTVWK